MPVDIEQLRSGGTLPTGPVSAWPKSRNEGLTAAAKTNQPHATKVRASAAKMASGLFRSAGQAVLHGRVSAEVRNERYDTCKACPFFIEDSKRCSECGCFMEAKTWIGGDPKLLCPKQKWAQ